MVIRMQVVGQELSRYYDLLTTLLERHQLTGVVRSMSMTSLYGKRSNGTTYTTKRA